MESGARPRLAEGLLWWLEDGRPFLAGVVVCSGHEYRLLRARLGLLAVCDGGVKVSGGFPGWRDEWRL